MSSLSSRSKPRRIWSTWQNQLKGFLSLVVPENSLGLDKNLVILYLLASEEVVVLYTVCVASPVIIPYLAYQFDMMAQGKIIITSKYEGKIMIKIK